jgi:sugar phosphate isomerase/epimerase
MRTRTGSFPIGFRRGWSDWQRGSVASLAQWASSVGFELLDVPTIAVAELGDLSKHGIRLGTADLQDFGRLMANDPADRAARIKQNVDHVRMLGAAGIKLFFSVVIPGDPNAKRADNHKLAVETYAPIAEAAASIGGFVVLEGWPGMDPILPSLACTPETVRSMLKEIPRGLALNYDPSHLIRLGVDHIRFLKEFAPHVKHVHGKDTDLDADALYEFGTQQPTFARPHGFGGATWRYTIPGHGLTRWTEAFTILKSAGYAGGVCIELEDEHFNGTEAGEKLALTTSAAFLASC